MRTSQAYGTNWTFEIKEANRTTNFINPEISSPKHILFKLPKINDKALAEWLSWLEHLPIHEKVVDWFLVRCIQEVTNQSMSLSFSLSQIKKHIPGEDKKILMTKNSQGSQRKPYYIIIFQWKHYKPGESGRKYSKYWKELSAKDNISSKIVL